MNKSLLLFIALLFLFINISFAKRRPSYLTNTDSSIAFTKFGAVKGLVKDTHRVFYGVPFASPPVGNLRWENPMDPKEWDSIKDTQNQKPQCAQKCNLGDGVCSDVGTSEDCLYLDIFTPKDAVKGKNYPVMVFIPGGAFSVGTGSARIFDASKFAQSNIIVVNINYRLGSFGFLGTDLMHGNYGFLDQIKALEFVKNNIEEFGGNPSKVCIYGESAGAFSVATHLTSTYSRQYFHSAISASSPLTIGLKDKTTARGFANRLANELNCKLEDQKCLRDKTMDQILDAQEKVTLSVGDKILDAFTIWSPVIDGDIIPMQPLVAAKEGKSYDVPIIVGNNHDEAIIFIYSFFKNEIGIDLYRALVIGVFPLNWQKILPLYPGAPRGQDSRPRLSELLNDYLFRCQDRYYITKLVQKNQSPAYHYKYVLVKSTGHQVGACSDKSCHGTELTLVFNSYKLLNENLNSDEREFGVDLNNYIVNFVTNHNPNTGLSVPIQWNQYSRTQNSTLIMDINFEARDTTTRDEKCDVLDLTYYRNQVRP